MTDTSRYFRVVKIKMVCADPSATTYALNAAGIALMRIRYLDDLTTEFYLRFPDYPRAVNIIEKYGGRITGTDRDKISFMIRRFIRRPVLVVGILLVMVLTLYLPTRVLFVTVSGNFNIPTHMVEEAASACGIRFGAPRRLIRSEKVKNELLSRIPELKWVGVNTKGCVAEISIRERASTEEVKEAPVISSIVASRDGVITDMTVVSGQAVGRIGQAVVRNDLLISGYSDCGRCIYGTRAQGEIYAKTQRSLTAFLPASNSCGESKGAARKKISLLIGKKRINFYKGSGIYDTTCVKMYSVYPLTLPGGWELPLTLIIQSGVERQPATLLKSEDAVTPVLQARARDYLEEQMIAGRIDGESCQVTVEENMIRLSGKYICHEMIGQTRIEEIMEQYGEDN